MKQNIPSYHTLKKRIISKAAMHPYLNLKDEDFERFVYLVMIVLGYNKFIADNLLTNEIRKDLYILENIQILYTFTRNISVNENTKWRIHFWAIKN